MKYIYLDNNIIIDLENERNPKVIDTVNKLREDGHRIVFSPAHLEEIANLVKHHEQTEERANKKITFLRDLTDSYCLLPYPMKNLRSIRNNGINTYKEHPKDTYSRVISMFHRNAAAENHQKHRLKNGEKIEASGTIKKIEANNSDIQKTLEEFRIHLKKIVRINHVDLKRDPILREFVPKEMITTSMLRFDYIRSYFPILEIVIEKLMEYLETQRYFPDRSDNYIASLHDTSHAIYAAYTDIFVTNDHKLARKIKAVYEWLGVKTKVMTRDEFVDFKDP